MLWKYVEIKSLDEADKNEDVCAIYPNPSKNVSGKNTEEKMKIAESNAKAGKCRLLVWRGEEDLPCPDGRSMKELIRKYLDEIWEESLTLPTPFSDAILEEVYQCIIDDEYEVTKQIVLEELLWCYMCKVQ